jgi:hypothetical protein
VPSWHQIFPFLLSISFLAAFRGFHVSAAGYYTLARETRFKRSRIILPARERKARAAMCSPQGGFKCHFNNWNNHYLFRDTLLRLIASSNLEYKELIKEEAA